MPQPSMFVSHSHKDNKFGIKLVDDLRQTLGSKETVWYDAAGGLQGGDDWWSKIVHEITTRDIFILILSPQALESPWVLTEFTLAFTQKHKQTGKRIIPIMYQQCEPRADMSMFQMINFFGQPYDKALNELLSALTPTQGPCASQLLPISQESVILPLSTLDAGLTDLGMDEHSQALFNSLEDTKRRLQTSIGVNSVLAMHSSKRASNYLLKLGRPNPQEDGNGQTLADAVIVSPVKTAYMRLEPMPEDPHCPNPFKRVVVAKWTTSDRWKVWEIFLDGASFRGWLMYDLYDVETFCQYILGTPSDPIWYSAFKQIQIEFERGYISAPF